jgi:hypothetical protein
MACTAVLAIGNSLMSLSYHTYQSELFPTQIRARARADLTSFAKAGDPSPDPSH